jgi:hypothetical protein
MACRYFWEHWYPGPDPHKELQARAPPTIERYRPVLGKAMMHATDRVVIAVVSDAPFALARELPWLDLNAPDDVGRFVVE